MRTFPALLTLVAASLVALFASGCGGSSDEGARIAARDFMSSMIAGDYAGAYQKGSMQMRTQTRFDDFSFEAGTLRAKPEATPTWSEPEEKDGVPVLQATVPRADGDPARVTLRMTREIQEWKVAKFDVE